MRRLALNDPDVVKGDLVACVSGDSFTEVRYLFMHVLQKVQAGTLDKIINSCVTIY